MKLKLHYVFIAVCMLTQLCSNAQTFFVSLSGNDNNPGSLQKPFATLEKARDAVRNNRKEGQPATVYVRGGVYYLTKSFILEMQDGGTEKAPVTYSAYKNEKVVLRTSTVVPLNTVKKVTDKATLQRIAPHLKDSIVEIDLSVVGIKNIKKYPDLFVDNGGIIEVFMNEERMQLSRYPNQGYMKMKKVIINGGGQEKKDEDWRNFYADGAKEKLPPRPGVFEYRDNRTNKWVNQLQRGVWLKGYWRIPWQNEAVRIAEIDTNAQTIKLAVPVPGGIGNKYTRPEGNGKEPYILLNLLEEIDQPGEWALDFTDKKLYFYPPAKINEGSLRIADNKSPALFINNASFVQIKKISIEESGNDGIKIFNGNNNLIAGCTVMNVTRNGITVDSGKAHTILSNNVMYTGATGIWLKGGNEYVTPKISSEFKVINNHVRRFGEIQKVYAAGINAGFTGGGGGGHHNCVGVQIAHNMVHEGPHAGILYGSWNHIFEYNEVFNFCMISDDMGGFYSYDLYERMGGHIFRYNFVHNSPLGDAFYFDNDHREVQIYGNLVALNSAPKRRGTAYLYKIGSQVKNPQTVTCYNNIAVNANYGYEVVTTGSALTNVFTNNVSVNCSKPFTYKYVTDKARDTAAAAITNGNNISYTADPGFINMKGYNFRLKPDSRILKDLPEFKPLPFDKMGLFLDEYRTKLPTDKEVNRFTDMISKDTYASEIADRQ